MGKLIRNGIDYTGGGSILYQADGSTLLAYANILDSKEAIEDNVADYNIVGANGLKEVLDGLSTGVELTRDEYDDLPASKLTDGIDYYITDEDGYEDMIDDSVTSDATTWSSEKINNILNGLAGYRIKSGTYTGHTNAGGAVNVFHNARFTNEYVFLCMSTANEVLYYNASPLSATNAYVYITNSSHQGYGDKDVSFNWIAIGKA